MSRRGSSFETRGSRFSPFIDVAINGMAAMFIFLVVYIAAVPPRKVPQLRIVTETLPAAVWYQGYHTAISASGGVGLYSFTLSPEEPLIDVGLIFDGSSGEIDGSPRPSTPVARFSSDSLSFLVTVTDESRQIDSSFFTLYFRPTTIPYDPETELLRIQANRLPPATVGRK